MHDANEIECSIFEIATKNIVLGKVTKGGVSDANNKLIINIIPTVGSHRPQPVAYRVNMSIHFINMFLLSVKTPQYSFLCI